MAIVNRDLDISEQTGVLPSVVSTSTGTTTQVAQLPFPATLRGVAVAANSISGAPVVSLSVKRYTPTGVTTIPFVGSTLAVLAIGASAPYQMIPLATAGSTLLNLQAGDVVALVQDGTNAGIGNAVVSVVVTPGQDIVKWFNINLG